MPRPSPQNLTSTLVSFIGLGVFIVLFICALIFFSYIFVIGAGIGLILFLISYIRALLYKKRHHEIHLKDGHSHRIIDQDDK